MSSPPHSPLSPFAEHEAGEEGVPLPERTLSLSESLASDSPSPCTPLATPLFTPVSHRERGMSDVVALVAEMRADREERKTETAQLKGQVQQLQQALLQLDGMAPPARSSLPSTAYQMLTTPPPVSETFGTGLRSAAAASAPQEGGVRRSLSSQLGAVGVKRSEPTVWEQITPGPTRDREEETGMRGTLRVKDMHKGVEGTRGVLWGGQKSSAPPVAHLGPWRMNNLDGPVPGRKRTTSKRSECGRLGHPFGPGERTHLGYQVTGGSRRRSCGERHSDGMRWIPLFISEARRTVDNHLLQVAGVQTTLHLPTEAAVVTCYKLEAEFDRLRLNSSTQRARSMLSVDKPDGRASTD